MEPTVDKSTASPPETIVASSPLKTQDEAVKRIDEKLCTIEKKLEDKWMLPVILAILGSLLTFGTYLLQRSFLNSEIFKNEFKRANAEFSAKSTSDFYKVCSQKLDTISKTFDTYCNISPSSEEDDIITNQAISLVSLIDQQFPIDPKVKQALANYINFVVSKVIDFNTKLISQGELKQACAQSKILYDKAVTEINAAFLNPER